MPVKILMLLAAVFAMPVTGFTADEAAYPSQRITLVVPFAAGGGTDGTARVLATALQAQLGQPVVVDNRPSAGGVASTAQVAKSKPDGYTLLWANTTTLGVSPYLYSNVPYDPVKSFQHISRAATGPLILVANPSVPATNVKELIAYAKAKPGALNFASAGVGTVIHLTGELFKSRAGIEIVHVPYKGNGPALTDVMSGQVQMMFIGVGHVAQYVNTGKLRAIAIASPKRHPLMPSVPTFAEAGMPDFEVTEWFGLAAPAGIPRNVLDTLTAAFRNAAATESVRKSFSGYGYDAISESPEAFRSAVEREGARWKSVIKSLGISASGG
jgi:tripartite-type tricarboxylate transporter receptor subunit TctC